MKIGIVANILQDRPFAEALDYFHKMGIQTIEPGCGGYAGKIKSLSVPIFNHCFI